MTVSPAPQHTRLDRSFDFWFGAATGLFLAGLATAVTDVALNGNECTGIRWLALAFFAASLVACAMVPKVRR